MLKRLHNSGILHPLLLTFIPVAGTAAVDGAVRGLEWSQGHNGVRLYLWSLAGVWMYWLLGRLLVQRARTRWPRATLTGAGVASLVLSLTWLSTVAYRGYFGAYPNLFTFEFLFEELGESAHIFTTQLRWFHLVAVLTLASAGVALTYPRWGAPALTSRYALPAVAIVALGNSFPLHNNVRLFPGAFPPEIQTVFSLTKTLENEVLGYAKPIRALGKSQRLPLSPVERTLPYNVLLIVNESLRAQSLSAYGYGRPTSTLLDEFLAQHKERTVLFQRPYANATRTMLAFPGILTGITAAQNTGYLHAAPLVFDYGKTFDHTSTFFISAHRLEWGNILYFLEGSPIDLIWHKSTGEAPVLHSRGLDDKYVAEKFAAWLSEHKGQPFLGVVHLRGTHMPYHSPPEAKRFEENTVVDVYDNSVVYADINQRAVLDALEQAGLLGTTLVISTSDHAEALGEHGYEGHIHSFYDEEARIPMWVSLPDALLEDTALVSMLRANASVPVSNADIVPTLLHLLELEDVPEIRDRTRWLLGSSLARAVSPERPILMQNHNDPSARYLFGGVGLVMGNLKYILRVQESLVFEELYDLSKDPAEKVNIWEQVPLATKKAIYAAMRQQKNSRVVLETHGRGSLYLQ